MPLKMVFPLEVLLAPVAYVSPLIRMRQIMPSKILGARKVPAALRTRSEKRLSNAFMMEARTTYLRGRLDVPL